jgi:hypothetical protein
MEVEREWSCFMQRRGLYAGLVILGEGLRKPELRADPDGD